MQVSSTRIPNGPVVAVASSGALRRSVTIAAATLFALFATAVMFTAVAAADVGVLPNPTITSPAPNAVFATNSVGITWEENSGETITDVNCELDSLPLPQHPGDDPACTPASVNYMLTQLTEEPHTFSLTYTDADDPGDPVTETVDFEVDTAPVIELPIDKIISPSISGFDIEIHDNTINVVGGTGTVDCSIGGGASVTCTQDLYELEKFKVEITGTFSEGDYPLTITATSNGTAGPLESQAVLPITIAFGDYGEPFSLEAVPSTTRAGRHPDLRVDIQNHTNLNPKTIELKMPEGFAGSLNAVSEKCPWPDSSMPGILDSGIQHTNSDVDQWCPPAMRANAKIGEVLVEGTVDDSRARLAGDVYMTDAETWGEAGGVAIDIPAKVSGLDLGHVVVASNLNVDPRDPGDGFNADIENNPRRVIASIGGAHPIPNTITSQHGTTEFTMKRTRMWLRGQNSGTQPLLTNPSNCSSSTPLSFELSVTTHIGAVFPSNGPGSPTEPELQPTDCDDQPFDPEMAISFFDPTDPETSIVPTAGQPFGLRTVMTNPPGSTTMREAQIHLPNSLRGIVSGLNGVPCLMPDLQQTPPACDSFEKRVGQVAIETPLLPDPLYGDLFIEEPAFGNYRMVAVIREESLGIQARIRGKIRLGNLPQTTQITFNTTNTDDPAALPDFPISKVTVDVTGSEAGEFPIDLNIKCMPEDSGAYRMLGHNGRVKVGTFSHAFAGCAARRVTIQPNGTSFSGGFSNGMGGTTSSTSPSLKVFLAGADASPVPNCTVMIDDPLGFDGHADTPPNPDFYGLITASEPAPVSCASIRTTGFVVNASNLKDGVHFITVKVGNYSVAGNPQPEGEYLWFKFVVDSPTDPGIPDTPPDTTEPETNITTPPATTSAERVPVIEFDADGEMADYQCRLTRVVGTAQLEESFQQCGWDSDTGSFAPDGQLDVGNYVFEVRAEDGVGNVDDSPASAAFEVKVPFGLAYDVVVSTTQARAHPTLEATLTTESNEDLRDAVLHMPTGFVGSLLGAQTRCTAAQAQAAVDDTGACPASSKVGTVKATVQSDMSEITQNGGEVFLTEPLIAGDPAGIVISMPGKVGAVDLGTISTRMRLIVRGNAEGVDAVDLDNVPNTVHDDLTGGDVAFHIRKLVVNLVGGTGATQPLLTNPSNCAPSAFTATFTSYASENNSPTDIPFQATNCDALPFYTAFAANIEKLDANFNPTGAVPTAGDSTRFTGTIAASPDDSGVKYARLELPRSLTATTAGLPLGCSYAVYEATKTCDKGDAAVIGSVVASTPLLPTPLEGKVYLGLAKPGSYIEPGYDETLRIILQMRGLISVDLIGRTMIKDFRAITIFENIPDAPVSSFNVTVDKIVRVRPTACDADLASRTITGFNQAYNDKVSNYNTDINVDCTGNIQWKASVGGKGKKARATVTGQATGGVKIRSAEITLPKGLNPIKKQFKNVQVIADGRKLRKCAKLSGRKVTVGLCGKTANKIELRFNKGTLNMPKKLKKASFTAKGTLSNGRSTTSQIGLSGRGLKKVSIKVL